jgi:hypothetical protein
MMGTTAERPARTIDGSLRSPTQRRPSVGDCWPVAATPDRDNAGLGVDPTGPPSLHTQRPALPGTRRQRSPDLEPSARPPSHWTVISEIAAQGIPGPSNVSTRHSRPRTCHLRVTASPAAETLLRRPPSIKGASRRQADDLRPPLTLVGHRRILASIGRWQQSSRP